MNERIIKLGLDSGMLNYVDHETPRHYFLCGNADEECLEKFAELIVQECLLSLEPDLYSKEIDYEFEQRFYKRCRDKIIKHFGVEE